jgi:alkanesulfonate monooxygenase SsuD/methylene tetrahydromethanopterin reductase-like flavin-dependent oxidoreductase (luciferase family)
VSETSGPRETSDFRLGICLPPYYPDVGGLDIVKNARLAEALGFDDVWCPDHIVFRRPICDLQVMAAMALAATERLQVCLGVMQLGLRHPVAVAKWLGALAQESPRRLVAGLGIGGDYREEWLNVGVDPAERGRRFDEALSVLPALLANQAVSHQGTYHQFDIEPLFASPPAKIPLWIGARLDGAIRRAAQADGFLAMVRTPDEFAAQRQELFTAAAARGLPDPQTGISVVASVVGTDAEAKARCGEFFRSVYGLPEGRGDRRSVGGVSAVHDLIEGYRSVGANRVSLMIIDPPEVAWPILADKCLG